MTAETAPQPERQVRAQGAHQQMVRYGILLAAVAHVLVRDRRFRATVITGAIGAVALASLVKNNQVRPVRRVAHWYKELGAKPGAGLRRSGRGAERPARTAR
jgi:ABC-type phosphate/phosphonate transport system permease subunit